jgi:hypothetical protein
MFAVEKKSAVILCRTYSPVARYKIKTDTPAFRRRLKMNKKAVTRNSDKIHQLAR